MSDHHEFGPSSLERRALCPASYVLEKGLPSVTSENAEAGTKFHAEIAALIDKYRGADIPETVDASPEALAMYAEFQTHLTGEDGESVFVEERLSYYYLGDELYFGSCDVLIVRQNEVELIDWKTGHRRVAEAENNYQGAAYAAAAMQRFNVERAVVTFFNPAIHQRTAWVFDNRAEIVAAILGVILKCEEDHPEIVPGEKQCRYCKAMAHGKCPAIRQEVEKLTIKADELAKMPTLDDLSDADLIEFFERVKALGDFMDVVKDKIKARAKANGSCGGYHIKESNGGATFPDIDAAFTAASDTLSNDEFLKCCSLTQAKLKAAWCKKKKESGEVKTAKAAEPMFAAIFDQIATPGTVRETLEKEKE